MKKTLKTLAIILDIAVMVLSLYQIYQYCVNRNAEIDEE